MIKESDQIEVYDFFQFTFRRVWVIYFYNLTRLIILNLIKNIYLFDFSLLM